jgi:hypothetical protein
MARSALPGRLWLIATYLGLMGCLVCTSCQSSGVFLAPDAINEDEPSNKPPAPIGLLLHPATPPLSEACSCGDAKSCNKPTVAALAHDLDTLEHHIEKYGSVVAQHPDVWGQARLTKHRENFEKQMEKELENFKFTLQGSLARSDQAYAADAFALSSAAAAASSGARGRGSASSSTAVVNNASDPASAGGATKSGTGGTGATKGGGTGGGGSDGGSTSGDGLPDQSDTFAAFNSMSRTGVSTVTGPTYTFPNNGAISVEPSVFLEQKSRYLNYLNHLRRINEGDDTADSPGYALNLVRIPVSVLPGKCTEVGHGAEVSMTLTPHLSDELLPTTFRNLIVNDLIEQIAYPITQFINNPQNSIYLDDRRESGQSGNLSVDVADLFQFVDQELVNLFPTVDVVDRDRRNAQFARSNNAIVRLLNLRTRLTLQPIFARSEWDWVDNMIRAARESLAIGGTIQDELVGLPATALKLYPGDPAKRQEFIRTEEQRLYTDYNQKNQKNQDLYRDKYSHTLQPAVVVAATKSRRAMLPFPPTQMVEVYGYDFIYQIVSEAYHGLRKERFTRPCPCDDKLYIHLPDIQGYLQEELAGAYKLLANPCNVDLWGTYCTQELAAAVRSHQTGRISELRRLFREAVRAKAREGAPPGRDISIREATVALAWAMIVESALLNEQLVQDMKESAAAKGCNCLPKGWQPYFLPDPPPEARSAFIEYVRCRWPIHVFALDPVTQQQNLSDVFSARREMQLAMSLAFVNGNISARNMMRYARRIEFDMATIDLNNTQIGFSHGDEAFGWRFFPRFQTPDIESNATVFFRDLVWGGPNRNTLLRQRRLEPGIRECVAIVIMPSFVPYADLTVTSNWFDLANPKCKLMDTRFAVALSKSVKTIETCGPGVLDTQCYRDGELDRLLQKAKQLEGRLPLQSTVVQIPYENTLGGFGMFNTGVTDLAPELNGWYGSPSINPNAATTLFLVGNHFSVHQTRVIAGGQEIDHIKGQEMLSRQVIKVVIPPFPILLGDANQKFVDIHLATPYGVSQHLLVPVCIPPCVPPCPYPTPACGGSSAPPPSYPPAVSINSMPPASDPALPPLSSPAAPATSDTPAPTRTGAGKKS